MSFNTMLTDMQTILNRDDCTTAQATIFMQQSIQRIQRTCRLPSMERAQLITPADPMSQIPVPPDLIQVIDLLVPTPASISGQFTALRKLSYRRLLEIPNLAFPVAYARSQTVIYIRGPVWVGTQLQFLYYGNFSPFATPDSDNELSASTPDLAVYGALSYAGDYFEHPLAAQWEARYQAIKGEVIQMGADLENEGGPSAVESIYTEDDY